MTSTSVDADALTAEIISSLTMDDVPMKLRCSSCGSLALNATKMPCCDQNICESCFEQACRDNECRVCLHTPVAQDLCKPNKTLRTTIKAFLKKKVMEKETQRKKEEAAKTSAIGTPTPVAVHSSNSIPAEKSEEDGKDLPASMSKVSDGVEDRICTDVSETSAAVPEGLGQKLSEMAQMDVPRQSIEEPSNPVGDMINRDSGKTEEQENSDQYQDGAESTRKSNNIEDQARKSQWPVDRTNDQAVVNGMVAPSAMTGAYPMDFSQVVQMMPNGIPNPMLNSFPNMIAMPGMGMDPVAMSQVMSQSMYGGFGGQVMGMNGMNMGMGFNAGQGVYGGFNGQVDAWTTGQDNYNANAYGANGMGGSFGAHAGHGGQGGYNMSSHQGNYNQMSQQHYSNNDFQSGYNNHGFQHRGRGRRGGYYNSGRGRDGYNHSQMMHRGNHNGNANYEALHHQPPLQIAQQNGLNTGSMDQQQQGDLETKATSNTATETTPKTLERDQADEEQMMKELNPGNEDDEPETGPKAEPNNVSQSSNDAPRADTIVDVHDNEAGNDSSIAQHISETVTQTTKEEDMPDKPEEPKPLPIQTFISSDEARMRLPYANGTTHYQKHSMPPPGAAPPAGAASQSSEQGGWARGAGRGYQRGINSMRGDYRGRGAAYLPNGNVTQAYTVATNSTANLHNAKPAEPRGLGVEGAPTGPKALREGLPCSGIRGGRGFSIVGRAPTAAQTWANSHTRSRSPSSSRQRSRSRTPSSSRHRSSHHRSHRHRSRSVSKETERERRKERRHRRSRKYDDEDGTPTDSQESRRRDTSQSSSNRRSSHRSHHHHEKESSSSTHRHHRERSRDRDRERDRDSNRDRDRDHDHHRYRDRDEDGSHRRTRERSPRSVTPTPTSAHSPDFPDFEKEDSRKRRDRDHDHNGSTRLPERKRSRRDRSPSPTHTHHSSRRNTLDHSPEHPPTPALETAIRPPTGPRRASTTNGSAPAPVPASAPKAIPTGPKEPEKDQHQLEREARNRERLMKEMQRRAKTEGIAPGRRGSRGGKWKYEDEGEEKVGKGEREKEGVRWS